jgi:hypothetical protein
MPAAHYIIKGDERILEDSDFVEEVLVEQMY